MNLMFFYIPLLRRKNLMIVFISESNACYLLRSVGIKITIQVINILKYLLLRFRCLTLSQLRLFMYVKQLGWGKITPPE